MIVIWCNKPYNRMIKFHFFTYLLRLFLTNMLQFTSFFLNSPKTKYKKKSCNKKNWNKKNRSERNEVRIFVLYFTYIFYISLCHLQTANFLCILVSRREEIRDGWIYVDKYKNPFFLCSLMSLVADENDCTQNDNSLCKWLRNHWTKNCLRI